MKLVNFKRIVDKLEGRKDRGSWRGSPSPKRFVLRNLSPFGQSSTSLYCSRPKTLTLLPVSLRKAISTPAPDEVRASRRGPVLSPMAELRFILFAGVFGSRLRG